MTNALAIDTTSQVLSLALMKDDGFSRIYDVNGKQEELEDKVERYKQSNWLPDSYYDKYYDKNYDEK